GGRQDRDQGADRPDDDRRDDRGREAEGGAGGMTGTVKTTKEPLFHVVKHAERTGRQMIGFRLLAVALSIVAGGLFILAIGHNPIAVYGTILEGAFRSKIAIQSTVKFAIPLCICALGVTLAFKMKFWNIGGEGQLIMGAVFASYFALNF